MSAPLISLLHPTARVKSTAAFPVGYRDALAAFLDRADNLGQIEYVIAVHESRWSEFWDGELSSHLPFGAGAAGGDVMRLAGVCGPHTLVVVKNTGRDCVVDQVNAAYRASTGKLLMGVQDDLYPPEHWDTLVLDACERLADRAESRGAAPSSDYVLDLDRSIVVVFSTGQDPERERELQMCNATTRKVLDRRGYALDPDFESMFSDNWWAFENRRDEKAGLLKIIDRLDICFEHRRVTDDEIYALQNRPAAYLEGHCTFARKAYGTRVLAVCSPGETFSAPVMWNRVDLILGLSQGRRFIVTRTAGHSSNVYCTRIDLTEGILNSPPRPDFDLWIDDDNQLTLEQFNLLYQDLLDHPELDGVVGWCWCDNHGNTDEQGRPVPMVMSVGRQEPDTLKCMKLTTKDWLEAERTGKWLVTSDDMAKDGHVFWSGFPVVLVRHSVHELLGWQAFQPILRDDVKWGFTSEDTSFFIRANQAGMKFGVDLRVKVPHAKLRAIEPFEAIGCENQAEYLKSKGLKAVPISEPLVASSAAD